MCSVEKFRKVHIALVKEYIMKQGKKLVVGEVHVHKEVGGETVKWPDTTACPLSFTLGVLILVLKGIARTQLKRLAPEAPTQKIS